MKGTRNFRIHVPYYVIAMGQELGLSCVAEGVETQAQVEALRESHCGLAQGFFFDRALSREDFEEKLSGFCYDLK